jgi:hypothetical protein
VLHNPISDLKVSPWLKKRRRKFYLKNKKWNPVTSRLRYQHDLYQIYKLKEAPQINKGKDI